MRKVWWAATAMITSASFWGGTALAEPVAILEPSVVLAEQLSETVKVSGAFVAGASFSGARPLENRPSLRAHVPANWAGRTVCMHARSLDGTYETKYEYHVPDDWRADAVADLRYDTSYPDLLAADTGNVEDGVPSFALSLSEGECAGGTGRMLVAYWNAADDETRRPVELYVNSLGADEVFVFAGRDADAPAIGCERLPGARARAFDHVCTLGPEALVQTATPVEINATRSGVRDPARFIEIVVPTGG